MRDLLDAEGENQAVRTFLMQYSCDRSITVGAMRSHMTRSGWGEEAIPQFARNTYSAEHLTKSGAQIWIRHLFDLERAIPEGAAIDARGTTYHNVAEIYYRAEEGESLHMVLDDKQVPRADADGRTLSLVGRVDRFGRKQRDTALGLLREVIESDEVEFHPAAYELASRIRALVEPALEFNPPDDLVASMRTLTGDAK